MVICWADAQNCYIMVIYIQTEKELKNNYIPVLYHFVIVSRQIGGFTLMLDC